MCEVSKAELEAIQARLSKIEADTSEMIEMFNALQGGFRVLQMIGRLAKPFGYISAAVTASVVAWTKLKGGA
ncbi:hypothetical protein ACMHYJ_10080 [Castellaniella hirudinis]|uniref:hypothetical protein n=1 Tax=Castellaniella hirudinis TaxID=1144617 RepID=UPI0039C1C6C2